MKVDNFDQNYEYNADVSLFDEIFSKKQIGFVLKNFFNQEEIDLVKQGLSEYNKEVFEVFPGYKALPRPFDYTINTDKEKYYDEAYYMEAAPTMVKIKQMFKEKLAAISNNSELLFARKDNDLSFSKSWSSFRELNPDKGLFELHCGNVFRLWNSEFFNHQYSSMNTTHLSCVVMINKPETEEDIVIYKPHFDEFPEKIDYKTLKRKDQKEVLLEDIESYNIKLNAGDLLLFDESNYWHVVPTFQGKENRLTFGGFISKFKDENKFMFWA